MTQDKPIRKREPPFGPLDIARIHSVVLVTIVINSQTCFSKFSVGFLWLPSQKKLSNTATQSNSQTSLLLSRTSHGESSCREKQNIYG